MAYSDTGPYYSTGYGQASNAGEVPPTTTATKPHVCARCGRQYAHARGLIRHRKQCEGRYDITCLVCGKMFTRTDKYKQHMNNKHPEAVVTM
ncbi:hypothetical protein BaRGS_00027457 [Batillaria attramentaria]|uniref:C2H2-type domain-containing protein n=1 Tax=Batillaria attramentaria TaxID=370345 RepID=A0ABD0K2A1_9CAEN